MLVSCLLLLAGLVLLYFGGDHLVKGSSSLAMRLGLTPLVVGLTVVAFGTSSPELAVSLRPRSASRPAKLPPARGGCGSISSSSPAGSPPWPAAATSFVQQACSIYTEHRNGEARGASSRRALAARAPILRVKTTMKFEVLGAYGGESPECQTTSLLFADRLLLDLGSATRGLDRDRQAAVESVLLTHSHFDHVRSLGFLVENRILANVSQPLAIYGSEATLRAVRRDILSPETAPILVREAERRSLVRFHALRDGETIELHGLPVTPIATNHTIPTFGFLIEQGEAALLWSSDTGPTTRIWKLANRTPTLRAVCLEASFHNALQPLADLSRHLTPQTLARELRKLDRGLPVLVHHIKPPSRARVLAELSALRNPDVSPLEQGKIYTV